MFQGVTVLRSQGFWVEDRIWDAAGLQDVPVESCANLTVLLSVLPEQVSDARASLADCVAAETESLGPLRPRHLHMETLCSSAGHMLLP